MYYIRILGFRALLLLSLLLFSQEAGSHPHVFIVTRYTLVFDDKGLAGIRVNWRFDEYFSAMITGDYDSDQNGVIAGVAGKKVLIKRLGSMPGWAQTVEQAVRGIAGLMVTTLGVLLLVSEMISGG